MDHGNRKPRRPFAQGACLVLAAAALAVCAACRDDLVIRYGIRAYNACRTGCSAAAMLAAAWLAAGIARWIRAAKQAAKPDVPDPPARKKLDEADRDAIYRELDGFRNGKWSGMQGLRELLRQLDSMNEYQAEMDRLLTQSEYLKDKPAEIVQRVEDCMYVNARKLINYMRVIQTKDPDVMDAKIRECLDKNADLLKKTDDFVVAVVGYVDGDMAPEEEAKTRQYVDDYMFVVLQAIELPEAYLK